MKGSSAPIRRGDIWYYNEELNKAPGRLIGARPVIVVSNDSCNEHSPGITIVPLTTKSKKWMPTHVYVHSTRTSTALCEQVSTVPRESLYVKFGVISEEEMSEIEAALRVQLGLKIRG